MKKLTFWVIFTLIISQLTVTLHLLNQHHKWFPKGLFCIRSIFVVLVFNSILLVLWILLGWRKSTKKNT